QRIIQSAVAVVRRIRKLPLNRHIAAHFATTVTALEPGARQTIWGLAPGYLGRLRTSAFVRPVYVRLNSASGTWRLSLRCTKFRRDWRHCGHRLAPGPDRLRGLCRVGPGNFTPSPSQIRT